jgi:hypothetical protein
MHGRCDGARVPASWTTASRSISEASSTSSHHLYSTPGVFVRELLQNATEPSGPAGMLEPGHRGTVRSS